MGVRGKVIYVLPDPPREESVSDARGEGPEAQGREAISRGEDARLLSGWEESELVYVELWCDGPRLKHRPIACSVAFISVAHYR